MRDLAGGFRQCLRRCGPFEMQRGFASMGERRVDFGEDALRGTAVGRERAERLRQVAGIKLFLIGLRIFGDEIQRQAEKRLASFE